MLKLPDIGAGLGRYLPTSPAALLEALEALGGNPAGLFERVAVLDEVVIAPPPLDRDRVGEGLHLPPRFIQRSMI